jgi:hypothetical protein
VFVFVVCSYRKPAAHASPFEREPRLRQFV